MTSMVNPSSSNELFLPNGGLKDLQHIPASRVREGLALPDSQAGTLTVFELGFLPRSDDEQGNSSHQHQPAKQRRNRNSLLLFCTRVDRPDIKNFLLVGVVESLIGESQSA